MTIAVILHNIRSLHNVGSIFRTADAASVAKLYLTGITPSPIDRLGRFRAPLAKVALGAEKSVAWEKTKSTSKLVDRLKRDGYKIFAVEQSSKSIPYYTLHATRYATRKVALILGSETKGVPSVILKKCDKILEIPMRGQKESLNVAVAFGIVAFSLMHD